ncbi:MAG TPA: hypothetical protein PLD25_14920 [Chloroflexota bacterium]|nr:hypothetical protein [Chloroflexota bacterium]
MKRIVIYIPSLILIVLAISRLANAQEVDDILPDAAPQAGNIAPQTAAYGPWEIAVLDDQNDVGSHLSMSVDWTTGMAAVAYYDATAGDLKLAQQTPGNCGPNQSWNCTILDNTSSADVGQHVSLAYRNDGGYGVVYFDAANGINRFTSPVAGIQGEVIEYVPGSTVGLFNALTYDLANTPHVAYNRSVSGPMDFGYANRIGAGGNCSLTWSCSVVQNYAGNISMDTSLLGAIGIAYNGVGGFLGYAHPVNSGGNCGEGKWQCDSLDNGSMLGTSLYMSRCLFPPCQTPTQMAYYNYTSQQVKHAVYVGSGQGNCPNNNNWRCSVIDSVGQTANYSALGIALVMVGSQPVIIYQDLNDQANGIVKMAYPQANGNCGTNNSYYCAVIDDGARGGGFVSVGSALDAVVVDGRIHIAYYDTNHGDLLLAYEPAPAPEQETIYLPYIQK